MRCGPTTTWWNPRHSSLPLTAFMDEAVGAPDKVVVMGPELKYRLLSLANDAPEPPFLPSGTKWSCLASLVPRLRSGCFQMGSSAGVKQHRHGKAAVYVQATHLRGPNAGCNQLYYAGVRSTLSAAGFMTPTGHELDNGQVNQYFPLVHVINAADQHNIRSNGSEQSHRSENPRVDPEKPGKLGAQIPRMQCGSSICSRFDFFAAHKCFRSFYVMYVTMFGSPNCSITVDLSRGAVGSRFSVQAAHVTSVWQPP